MQSVLTAVVLSPELEQKRDALYSHLQSLGKLLVAYSGGVDSAYLAWAAHQVLGDEMLAVIADSPSLARSQMRDAVAFAEECKFPLKTLRTDELENPNYSRNDSMRCFHCKDELFGVMERFRDEQGFTSVAYGINSDDQSDWRPGQKAATQHGVAAPLLQTGLTKSDIRTLAASAGLRVWNKATSACLSSRIEYGRAVTREALEQVEYAEELLRESGFQQFRVRHHGDIARIEIARAELGRALDLKFFERVTKGLKELGFKYVTLDMEGFRSGSMNAVLPIETLSQKP